MIVKNVSSQSSNHNKRERCFVPHLGMNADISVRFIVPFFLSHNAGRGRGVCVCVVCVWKKTIHSIFLLLFFCSLSPYQNFKQQEHLNSKAKWYLFGEPDLSPD